MPHMRCSTVCLLAALAVVDATPILKKRGTTLHGASRLYRREPAYLTHEPAIVAAKYAQHFDRISADAKLVKRAAVPLTDEVSQGIDEEWVDYGGVSIGTPAQVIQVDFDTGSSDLWVPIVATGGATPFVPARSSTYKQTTQPFQITYGSGAVVGTVATDNVVVGGIAAPNQAFGAVTSVSRQFIGSPSAGILGLAFPSIATDKDPPVAYTARVAVFGFRLTRGGANSVLDFGALDPAHYTGAFQYTNVTAQTYWEVAATGMYVNGALATASFPAAIDTGTTLIYLPTTAAQAFYAKIPGSRALSSGAYAYPCSFAGTVGLAFAGTGVINLSSADLNLGRVSTTLCEGAVMAQNIQDASGRALAIVGDVFLKSVYTAFDIAGNRVGFATPT